MTLKNRLQQYAKQPNNADGREVTSQTLAAIKKDLLEIIGEDEVFEKSGKKYLTRTERTKVTRNQLRAELRERLERYIGK